MNATLPHGAPLNGVAKLCAASSPKESSTSLQKIPKTKKSIQTQTDPIPEPHSPQITYVVLHLMIGYQLIFSSVRILGTVRAGIGIEIEKGTMIETEIGETARIGTAEIEVGNGIGGTVGIVGIGAEKVRGEAIATKETEARVWSAREHLSVVGAEVLQIEPSLSADRAVGP